MAALEAPLDDGTQFTRPLLDRLFDSEVRLFAGVPNIEEAAALFRQMVVSDDFTEFLTMPAHELLG